MKPGIRIIFAMLVAMTPAALRPETAPPGGEGARGLEGDLILGARAGYSLLLGTYGNSFRGSYCAGASLSYGNPALLRFMRGELEFAYARHPMREGTGSYLQSFSVSIGPLAYYPAARFFHPYAGVSLRGSYLHLHAEKSRKNVKMFKPGLLARAGFYIPLTKGFTLRVGTDYSLEYLSGKPLHGLQFIGGVSYNFKSGARDYGDPLLDDGAVRIERLMALGEKDLAEGKVEDAKAHYRAALDLDPRHRGANEALRSLSKAEEDFGRAMKFSGEKRHFDALALLEGPGEILPKARAEQAKLRKLLAGEVPALERSGIELYEKGEYRGCIATMKRLLLIDPNNRVGTIYLPRAQKRQEALDRLR